LKNSGKYSISVTTRKSLAFYSAPERRLKITKWRRLLPKSGMISLNYNFWSILWSLKSYRITSKRKFKEVLEIYELSKGKGNEIKNSKKKILFFSSFYPNLVKKESLKKFAES
jgi:hypothetical protein